MRGKCGKFVIKTICFTKEENEDVAKLRSNGVEISLRSGINFNCCIIDKVDICYGSVINHFICYGSSTTNISSNCSNSPSIKFTSWNNDFASGMARASHSFRIEATKSFTHATIGTGAMTCSSSIMATFFSTSERCFLMSLSFTCLPLA